MNPWQSGESPEGLRVLVWAPHSRFGSCFVAERIHTVRDGNRWHDSARDESCLWYPDHKWMPLPPPVWDKE